MSCKNSQVEWLFRLISIFVGIIFFLCIGEIVIRIFTPIILKISGRAIPPMYIEDEKLGWKLKPNFKGVAETAEFSTKININSDGFRDDEHSSSNKATFKILGLGDSFTFGSGVELEETYLSLLEEYLNSFQGNSIFYEIVKTGIPGYSIKEEFILFEEYGLKIHPDLIMIGFDINDHTDCINAQSKYKVVKGYVIPRGDEKKIFNNVIFSKFRVFLHEHSYLYAYLDISIKIIKRRLDVIKGGVTEERFDKEKKRKAWECAADYLGRISEIAEANGVELLIVYIPHRSQVYSGLKQDRHIINEYFDDLDGILEDFCERNNVFYVNLLPHFIKAAEEGGQLYHITTDAHWNPNGHILAAEVIDRFFLNNNLLVKNNNENN